MFFYLLPITNLYGWQILLSHLTHNFVKKLENCLEKYQISISKIINAEYVEKYFNNDDDLFIKAKKITEGCNPNEIEFLNKSKKVLEELENSVELKKITVEKKIEKSLKSKSKYKPKNFKKKKFYRKNKSKRSK